MRGELGRWLAVVAAALALPACKRLETGAREHFGRLESCPDERVTVRARADLRWGDLVAAARPPAEPPDEIKRDPARLAKWQRDRAEERNGQRSALDAIEVFEATGCGHTRIFGCIHPRSPEGDSVRTGEVVCFEPPPARPR